jgi:hypothetical protein
MRCLVLFAFVLGASAQTHPAAPSSANSARPKDIQSLVDRVPLAPPELGSDILLRLTESNRITDHAWKIELLDEAFQLAGRAKYPLPLPGAVPSASHADSDVAKLWVALDQRLSGLVLQCRAIRAMLATDKKTALDLFLDMPLPQMPPLSCKDATGYDPTDYYVTLKEVAERAFTDRERREGKPFALLERAIRSMNSPFQVYPALELILDLQVLPTDQFAALITAYSSVLKQLNSEDRAFSGCTGYALFQRLLRLARICRERDVSPHALVDAFRSYFVKHMSGMRCAESVDAEGTGIILTRIGEMFNSHLQPFADDVPAIDIDKDELKPAGVGEAARIFDYWETPQTKSLLKHVAELSYGTEEQRAMYQKPHPPQEIHGPDLLPVEVRREPEWEARAVAFLDELENWKKDRDETEANYFHQVCELYTLLIQAIPPGPLRDRVLRSNVLFLRGAQIKRSSPPEWYYQLHKLMHLYGASADELAHIGDEIKKSGDDLMALYVDLNSFEKNRTR